MARVTEDVQDIEEQVRKMRSNPETQRKQTICRECSHSGFSGVYCDLVTGCCCGKGSVWAHIASGKTCPENKW